MKVTPAEGSPRSPASSRPDRDGPESSQDGALESFHPAVRAWFLQAFDRPTPVQSKAWPVIARGDSTLLLAPTGSGKTLAAFLVAIDRLMFGPQVDPQRGEHDSAPPRRSVRILYISPLKALGVDVERNLRAPLAGVRAVAEREGVAYRLPRVGVRSGDTPAIERQRMHRDAPDILITTPESIFLMLTSRIRETLRDVEVVIVDEIHSLVGNKRGAHLFVSLERLEDLRRAEDRSRSAMQRIGLSATQRPLDEIARLLGGAEVSADAAQAPQPRPVEIVQAQDRKALQLRIEVPVDDMARPGETSSAAAGSAVPSIWPSIHPRLVELIRQHRSTMVFVNSRRLAERLAGAINDLAGEPLCMAHHGSIAKDARILIEDRLKSGQLPAIVATSSLELGIDMGAVDLVIQIESPPSIASGIQRIGRGGHQFGAPSRGVIFPKYRGDLLAAAAAVEGMEQGAVEATYYPRNPLDVLAQQVTAVVAAGPTTVEEIYSILRGAAPFFELPRRSLESVLDLLSGRYPSHELASLKPKITWDRLADTLLPRRGTQRLAILNAGTIPDRGLYGVYLETSGGKASRVGELDEEMVFEIHAGDVFRLGASSWRVLDITGDRVLVAPAAGEPGRMPFWRGDGPGRSAEFGRRIGRLVHRLLEMSPAAAREQLVTHSHLDGRAADNLVRYLLEQKETAGVVPSDRSLVVECFQDEIGDWRIALLSPFGAPVHAPWAMAVAANLRRETSAEVDLMWSDDGIIFRLPESQQPPPLQHFFPRADEVEETVVRELGGTALFAARFRENAARALLLPRREPGKRNPLWLQRRRAADLLAAASRYSDFPLLLETYRECLRDVFDLKELKDLLIQVERRAIRVTQIVTPSPSPFASTLLFGYIGHYIYEGDTPLAERRAAALSLDHRQLKELLGDAELRELLDPQAIDHVALILQRLDGARPIRGSDMLHEMLLELGDLDRHEIAARLAAPQAPCFSLPSATQPQLAALDRTAIGHEAHGWIVDLAHRRRIVEVRVAGTSRFIAAEDASRYRDALGIVLPAGLPEAFVKPVEHPLEDLLVRFARTHVPFTCELPAQRFGLGVAVVEKVLEQLATRGAVVPGAFLPEGRGREWSSPEVLRMIKGRSLARLRQQVEPVPPATLARFLIQWQGIDRRTSSRGILMEAVADLQGLALPASALEHEILPARVHGYRPGDLDACCAAGEVMWRGFESLPGGDGRIALYLADNYRLLAPPPAAIDDPEADAIRALLAERGAVFFESIVQALGGFPNDLIERLWELVWSGHLTNDTLLPLRSLRSNQDIPRGRPPRGTIGPRRLRAPERLLRPRHSRLPGSEGRWSLLATRGGTSATATERLAATTDQLLDRYGLVTRETVAAESVPGGFAAIYPILRAMEEAGRVRRGYFVAGLGAAQFALPGAEERLRELAAATKEASQATFVLAATDPANPYGSALAWPQPSEGQTGRPGRAAGAKVIIHHGELIAHLNKTGKQLLTFLADAAAENDSAALLEALTEQAESGHTVWIASIDGVAACESPWKQRFVRAGFTATSRGLLLRRRVK